MSAHGWLREPAEIGAGGSTRRRSMPPGVGRIEARLRDRLPERFGGRTVTVVSLKPARRVAGLITFDDDTALFFKRLAPSESARRLRREAQLAALVRANDGLDALRRLMPEVLYCDDRAHLLVTEGLRTYETLRQVCGSRPPADAALLERIGAGLAQCHAQSRRYTQALRDQAFLHLEPPVSTYGHVTVDRLSQAPGREYGAYLSVVQGINDSLRRLKAAWRPACLIHGDFKDDNILLDVAAASRAGWEGAAVKFVDWELAGLGDPLWDVGSLVGQFLLYWVTSIRPGAGQGLRDWIANAAVRMDDVRSAIQHFLRGYERVSAVPALTRAEQGNRIVQYAGQFLLHRAQAALEVHGTLTTQAYCCLHVGKTLVSAPDVGARMLLANGGDGERSGPGGGPAAREEAA